MLNEMLSRFELLLNTVVRIKRKEKIICQQLILFKIREHWIDVRFRIVKLESGGQKLPVTKKNLSRNIFNFEKPLFY